MTQNGQGEEPSPRPAREGIVLPSDGSAPSCRAPHRTTRPRQAASPGTSPGAPDDRHRLRRVRSTAARPRVGRTRHRTGRPPHRRGARCPTPRLGGTAIRARGRGMGCRAPRRGRGTEPRGTIRRRSTVRRARPRRRSTGRRVPPRRRSTGRRTPTPCASGAPPRLRRVLGATSTLRPTHRLPRWGSRLTREGSRRRGRPRRRRGRRGTGRRSGRTDSGHRRLSMARRRHCLRRGTRHRRCRAAPLGSSPRSDTAIRRRLQALPVRRRRMRTACRRLPMARMRGCLRRRTWRGRCRVARLGRRRRVALQGSSRRSDMALRRRLLVPPVRRRRMRTARRRLPMARRRHCLRPGTRPRRCQVARLRRRRRAVT